MQFAGGAAWVLRVGMVIYLAAMVLALRLPDQVDYPPRPAAQARPRPARPAARRPAAGEPEARPPEARRRPDLRAGRAGAMLPAAAAIATRGDPGQATGRAARRRRRRARRPPGPGRPRPRRQGAPPKPARGRWRTLRRVGPVVAEAMAGNAVLRAFSGYMFFFFAFLLRDRAASRRLRSNFALAALAVAVGGRQHRRNGHRVLRSAPGPRS